ncbi:hypothetical protein KFK09_011472 [Dendrobium nobile]|uniref:Uncharacterized protein n=1 Tax=Dendrobium nobile TaxID=94219 RepID=A0A8T3BCS6_DENNO|nr:hypothetical protein KFK09_011472 [Dendrobium nobile]
MLQQIGIWIRERHRISQILLNIYRWQLPITDRTLLRLETGARSIYQVQVQDADWAGDPISRKSTSGYCSFLVKILISWTFKNQHTVSRSSTESKYRALAALNLNIIWIRRLLTKFGIP